MAAAVSRMQVAAPPAEQRLLLHTSWKEYVLLRDVLDSPGVRMTYLEGALEIMSPSPEHEKRKTNIARLIEMHAYIKGIDLRGYGSTTFKREAKERGAEPDECYLIGKKLADYPEIVLEVIQTSPLLDKLEVYAGMEVPEAWIFEEGAFSIHGLVDGRYVPRAASAFFPDLDFALVARFATRELTLQDLREFEACVRA